MTNPTPRNKHKSEVPPALKNGKVTPITGRRERHMPKLIII